MIHLCFGHTTVSVTHCIVVEIACVIDLLIYHDHIC